MVCSPTTFTRPVNPNATPTHILWVWGYSGSGCYGVNPSDPNFSQVGYGLTCKTCLIRSELHFLLVRVWVAGWFGANGPNLLPLPQQPLISLFLLLFFPFFLSNSFTITTAAHLPFSYLSTFYFKSLGFSIISLQVRQTATLSCFRSDILPSLVSDLTRRLLLFQIWHVTHYLF